MRTLCSCLATTVFTSALVCLAPGCGGSSNELEKPPVVTKPMNPETDMPGFKDMQDKLKAQGKVKK